MQQKRLVLALVISTTILLGWNYLFPIKPPQRPSQSNPAIAAKPSSSIPPAAPQNVPQKGNTTSAPETAARRTITVTTPLYVAKFDSQGAMVTSWILRKNRENSRELYSAASDKKHRVPLELISPKGLEHEPREAPLKLYTGDAALDDVLYSRNYEFQGAGNSVGDAEINLVGNEKKRVSFSLKDGATNIEVNKAITFDAQSYATELEINLKRSGVSVPQLKLQIGPSIGDQGIKRYSFYSVAPEAIASVSDKVERYTGNAINENKTGADRVSLPGEVDWAGVGDTYFAMVAIPSRKLTGLDYVTSEYDYQESARPEKRFLTRALVPVPADGSPTVLYVGPKDHNLLKSASDQIGAEVGRKLDLEGLINYGWLALISRPIAVPILWSITKLHDITGSYGVAIMLFTIIIYSAFFPLKWRSSKAMKKAQKLAPRMKELQEKIKGMKQSDPRLKELQVEQLRLMKEGNPLGGCLPLLIQMPFLFALYRAITISLDFRQAAFLWLPDLSAGDPYHVLEIAMAGTMIILQLITPAPSADPLQRKMMAIGMPLFMLYVLWGAPAGLLVYWLVGNIVGFSQQFVINRYTRSEDDPQPPSEKKTETRARKKVGAPRVSQA